MSNKKNLVTILVSVFLVAIFFSSTTSFQPAHATPIFGSESNVSQEELGGGTPGSSPTDIASSGSDTYVAWLDAGGNLWFGASHDNGTSFTSISLMLVPPAISSPKISVAGNNVYLSYVDSTGLELEISTDKGATFNGGPSSPDVATIFANGVTTMGAPIAIGTTTSSDFSTSASGDRVFMSWINSTDNRVEFASVKNSSTIDIGKTLSAALPAFAPLTPMIKSVGSNVYVAWEDLNVDPGNGEIFFSYSNNNGTSFTGPTNLSSTTSSPSSAPVLASAGNNVYAVWQEGTSPSSEIFFSASTNNGASFGSTKNLSHNTGDSVSPDITASGSSVYVAWKDDQVAGASLNNDVLFAASTNTGSSFGLVQNLSNDPGDASNVHLSSAGSNVDVTWLDTTINPSPGDVFYKSSADNGATFGGLKKINSNSLIAPGLLISSSSNHVAITWPAVFSGGSDAFLGVGIPSALSVSFDKTQYALGETPTLTVKDPASNISGAVDTIFSTVSSSTSDPGGVSVQLTETGGNTGVFTRQLHFHAGASNATNATLSAGPTEIIKSVFGGQDAISTTVPVTVAFDFAGYDKSDIAHVTVTDNTANVNPSLAESITVKVTSNANPSGVTMQLTETGPNTGIFGGPSLDKLIFMEDGLIPTSGTVTITQKDTTGPLGAVPETVTSTSDPVGTSITLTETGSGTGIFTGKLKLGTLTVAGSTIKVKAGDIVSFNYGPGVAIQNTMVAPVNATNGAILVTSGLSTDNVKVTYRGVTAQATAGNTLPFGGGSGSILRASLVVDAVASVGGSGSVAPSFSLTNLALAPNANIPANIKNEVLNRDPNVPIAPDRTTQFNFPLIIDGGGYPLAGYSNKIVTVIEKTNTPVDLKLNIPATNLVHLALYTNLHGTENDLLKSDTYIIYDKGQPLNIVDPHHYFDHVKFDMTTTKGILNQVDYTITFANPMDKSNIIFRTWNDRSASSDVVIQDAWQVTEGPTLTSSSQLAPSQEQNIPIPQTSTVPQGISDIISKIKDWGGFSPNPITDSELLSDIGIQGKDIPNWTQRMSKMVIDGDLTPQEFEAALKYLASIGIVK